MSLTSEFNSDRVKMTRRQLMSKYHPDRYQNEGLKKEATELFKLIPDRDRVNSNVKSNPSPNQSNQNSWTRDWFKNDWSKKSKVKVDYEYNHEEWADVRKSI